LRSEGWEISIISHLTKNTYFHTYQIFQYVKDTWAIGYSVSGMNKWLHQHRFGYKQPKGVPRKFDLKNKLSLLLNMKP
jgi:hypothetical protein